MIKKQKLKKLFCNVAQIDLNRIDMNLEHEEDLKGMIENPLSETYVYNSSTNHIGSTSKLLARA